jgi:hypothetical protein
LAHLLAGVCWLAVPCHSVGDYRLFFNANAGEPLTGASENNLN